MSGPWRNQRPGFERYKNRLRQRGRVAQPNDKRPATRRPIGLAALAERNRRTTGEWKCCADLESVARVGGFYRGDHPGAIPGDRLEEEYWPLDHLVWNTLVAQTIHEAPAILHASKKDIAARIKPRTV